MQQTLSVAGLLLMPWFSVAPLGCGGEVARPAAQLDRSVAGAELGASRTHSEFDRHIDAYFFLSCINEVTHWVGDSHVSVDTTTTPTGLISVRLQGRADAFYVERANGVRYDMIGQGSTQVHELSGPVTLYDDTEPKVFRSADGDVLVTNFTFHIVMDGDGNIVTVQATGACP